MNEEDDKNRNPLLLPGAPEPKRMRGCPKCGDRNSYIGTNVQGVISWKCNACGNKWYGGLPQTPQDPTVPLPPTDPLQEPSLQFVKGPKGEVLELRRKVSPVQEFRKGLPIPKEGEE